MSTTSTKAESLQASIVVARIQEEWSTHTSASSIHRYDPEHLEAQIRIVQKSALESGKETPTPSIYIVGLHCCDSDSAALHNLHRRAQDLLELPDLDRFGGTVELYRYPPSLATRYKLKDIPQD